MKNMQNSENQTSQQGPLSQISFGEIDRTWEKYTLRSAPLLIGETETKYKAIIRDESLVAIVRKGYELLPNEEAVELANQAADLAKLVPFDEFRGEWYQKMGDHVIYNNADTKVHALYASNKHYTVQGEKMHLGVGIHNSIDGTMGFGCGIFSFRHACSNMVFAGMRGYEQAFDQRKTIEAIYKVHRKGLGVVTKELGNTILGIMERVEDIIASYNQMAEEKITAELIEKLTKSRLPKKVLPEFIREAETPEAAILANSDVTVWNVYNDITEAIWHNEKNDMDNKQWNFTNLHKVIPLVVRRI